MATATRTGSRKEAPPWGTRWERTEEELRRRKRRELWEEEELRRGWACPSAASLLDGMARRERKGRRTGWRMAEQADPGRSVGERHRGSVLMCKGRPATTRSHSLAARADNLTFLSPRSAVL